MARRVNVIGVGMVKFQKPGQSDEYNVMASNAIRAAIKDSGVDFKDVESLKKMLSVNGKILSRKRTGASAAEQRMITDAIKRARFLGMLPYVGGSAI